MKFILVLVASITAQNCGLGVKTSCTDGACCSRWGWCGNTSEHCDAGCQSDFGKCGSSFVSTPVARMKDCSNAANASNRKMVAITIDDGPTRIKSIVDLFQCINQPTTCKKVTKATFFVNGANIKGSQVADIKRAISLGYQIASHTWSHQHMGSLSDSAAIKEITDNDALLKTYLGGKVPRYFRFPFLEENNAALKYLQQNNKVVVDVSLDSKDFETSLTTAMNNIRKGVTTSKKSYIQLSHEFPTFTISFLKENIAYWRSQGYEFVSIDECYGNKGAYI